MKKKVEKIYFIYLMAIGILFLYMCSNLQLNIKKQEISYGYETLTDYKVSSYKIGNGAQGIRQDYSFELKDVDDNYNWLIFYTYHQNISVYLEDECIYKVSPSKFNSFGKTSGYVWNSVAFEQADNGKIVRVVITPIYNSSLDDVPVFYFGNRFDIIKMILLNSLPILLLSLVSLLVGIIFILFSIVNGRNTDAGNSLTYIGIFAVLVGLWKLTDMEVFAFISVKCLAFSYLPFIALMLIEIPFILYVKELYHTKESPVWYIFCGISLVQIAVVLLLQVNGKLDLRQSLVSTHVLMVLIILLTGVMSVWEWFKYGWNAKLKRGMICILVCLVGTVIDMLLFYNSDAKEASVLAMMFFIVYILVMGYTSMQDIKQLLHDGMKAQHYEQIAHHDQLTGLGNRTAYAELIGDEEFDPTKYIVVMLDLNDLKKCNDVLGHAKGDIYIRESARVIEECFGDLGHCFRVGGDEFCVLLKSNSLNACRSRVDLMHSKVYQFNRETTTGINMQIACGFEKYDKRIDYDIEDTARRADRNMYQDKFTMKKQL